MTEDEMPGQHHRLDGHEFEQVPGVGDGLAGLVCCSPWGGKEVDPTEQMNELISLKTENEQQISLITLLSRSEEKRSQQVWSLNSLGHKYTRCFRSLLSCLNPPPRERDKA